MNNRRNESSMSRTRFEPNVLPAMAQAMQGSANSGRIKPCRAYWIVAIVVPMVDPSLFVARAACVGNPAIM